LFTIRLSGVSPEVPTNFIRTHFSQFGEIADMYRPADLGRSIVPCQYIFIRYHSEEAMKNAILQTDGRYLYGKEIRVVMAIQNSYFTQDTGYMTNESLDKKVVVVDKFDSSMPIQHHAVKREEEIKEVDVTFNLRVDDISPSIPIETIRDIFKQFGEISSVYYPMNLKTKLYRGFAIIRYLEYNDAQRAMNEMHNNILCGIGRRILVSWSTSTSYFGQDESVNSDRKQKEYP
jgi:RNA recognition motif-containing protein